MPKLALPINHSTPHFGKKQTGVVLMVTLIALIIMLLASVALIRSTDTNLLLAGNMAFKRDLVNQMERAIPEIKERMVTGVLAGAASQTTNEDNNYYATTQDTNENGVPAALLSIAENNANNIVDDTTKVRIRYVIDRMCVAGTTVADISKCVMAASTDNLGNFCNPCTTGPGGNSYPIYRISMWATGPRNTQAFIQTTYSN